MGNVNMEARQVHYRGGDKPMSVEDALKSTAGEAAAIAQLQTDVANLSGAKANQITIAPFFSAEESYTVGDLVYYNGLSYKCIADHSGEWDAADFEATTIARELQNAGGGGIVDYSTAEQNTGVKWIDGKDVYCKVIVLTNAVNVNGNAWLEHVDTIAGETCISVHVLNTSGYCFPFGGGFNSGELEVLNSRSTAVENVKTIICSYTKVTT